MPVIVFRCDASPHIGTGHVMRCLTLAQKFKERRFHVSFLSTQETLETVRALRESGFPVHIGNEMSHADWLVVDHYGLDKSYESAARRWTKNIMVIDDLADRAHDCDLLMDQTYGRDPSDYKALVPETCKILAGAQYALLRKDFSRLRQTLDRDFSKAQRVLISFGGINPKGATEYTLSMIRGYKEKSLDIDVVTGAGALSLLSVKDAVAAIENDGFHKITLHLDTPHIANLMVQADLCIGAAGATSWERCCLKLPTIALELADNQKLVLENLEKAGAIYNMGSVDTLKAPDFLEVFSRLMAPNSETLRQDMGQKAGALCHGQGTDRVFCLFLKKWQNPDDPFPCALPMKKIAGPSSNGRPIHRSENMPEIREPPHGKNIRHGFPAVWIIPTGNSLLWNMTGKRQALPVWIKKMRKNGRI